MEEELDEMQGRTLKGKVICVLVFLLTLVVLMGLLVGITKLDIGGISSQTLAPVIGDVPVLRSVLPKDLQQKTPKELQAEADAAQAAADAQAEADAQAQADAQAEADAQKAADEQAQAQADAEAQAQAEADAEAQAEADAQAQADAEAALQDYVDTYSAMKPKDAASVFDSMMPDQEDLIVKILEKLTPDQRAAILSKMSVANAAALTTKMDSNL